jgi:hypothetical protein
MTWDTVSQIGIGICGCSSVWFVGRKTKRQRRWGYIIGFLGQPFWLYTTIHNKQYVITGLSLWYAYSWARGAYNHWLVEDTQ